MMSGLKVASRAFPIGILIALLTMTDPPGAAAGPAAGGVWTPFVANGGQLPAELAFEASTLGGSVAVTRDGRILHRFVRPRGDARRAGYVVQETFLNGETREVLGRERSPVRVSHFRGGRPEAWHRDLKAFEAIDLSEVYPGIDVRLRATEGHAEKLFVVRPGGSPSDIRIAVEGMDSLEREPGGALRLAWPGCAAHLSRPRAYQETEEGRKPVEVSYAVSGRTYGFSVGEYDASRTLIIDPLMASSFLGMLALDLAEAVALDADGNVFVTGYTASPDFPYVPGAYDSLAGGDEDVFVAKFDATLGSLVACSFLGGSQADEAMAMCVTPQGDVYVAGNTLSSDFPTTPGSYDRSYNGDTPGPYTAGGDVFVCRMNGDLTGLLASTFLGGSEFDYGRGVEVGQDGRVYVVGYTASDSFPVTPGAFDPVFTPGGEWGGVDCFVSRMSANLDALQASTFLGGTAFDGLEDLVLDAGGNVYVTGWTRSANYPFTSGAFDSTRGGVYDAIISRLDPSLSTLLASTYFGGGSWDFGYGMTLDGSGNVYITGHTASATGFPVSPGAYDETFNGVGGAGVGDDAFVAKLNPGLTTRLACTYFGAADWEIGWSIVWDSGDFIYVGGTTNSDSLPTTPGCYDDTYDGGGLYYRAEGYIARFDLGLTQLTASTYLGGANDEYLADVAWDPRGRLYLSGGTSSPTFPTTAGAYDTQYAGDYDVFVSLFDSLLTEGSTRVGELPGPALRAGAANHPDPFRNETRISYVLDAEEDVTVAVFDVAGREVRRWQEGLRPAGRHELAWDGCDGSGREAPPGLYFLAVQAGTEQVTDKMLLLR